MRALKYICGLSAAALVGLSVQTADADTIQLRVASGHPTVNTLVGLLDEYFLPEVAKRVESRTDHKMEFVKGYGGSMARVADVLEGVQSGVIDIGHYCFCFEPSNLPLHGFQIMLPFGTMDPEQSVKLVRSVYDRVPYLSEVFEQRFNQKLLALGADNGYNLGTDFEWRTVEDIKGRKIAGAGLNLKWLEFVGAVPVQSSLPDAYTSMKTGVYNGWIMFPDGYLNFKLHEVGKYYTLIGFGAMTWNGITINKRRFDSLPDEVKDILLEVAREYELLTGQKNKTNYVEQLEQLKKDGALVVELPDEVRAAWASSLESWPQEKADELGKAGLPAAEVLNAALEEAEKLGYEWPVRYPVK